MYLCLYLYLLNTSCHIVFKKGKKVITPENFQTSLRTKHRFWARSSFRSNDYVCVSFSKTIDQTHCFCEYKMRNTFFFTSVAIFAENFRFVNKRKENTNVVVKKSKFRIWSPLKPINLESFYTSKWLEHYFAVLTRFQLENTLQVWNIGLSVCNTGVIEKKRALQSRLELMTFL